MVMYPLLGLGPTPIPGSQDSVARGYAGARGERPWNGDRSSQRSRRLAKSIDRKIPKGPSARQERPIDTLHRRDGGIAWIVRAEGCARLAASPSPVPMSRKGVLGCSAD